MNSPAVWFPTIRCHSGTDVFTERLAQALRARGIRVDITWLPHRAEYAPWTVPIPRPPAWANIVHINSWLPPRFVPEGLPVVVTVHLCVHDPALEPFKRCPQKIYHKLWISPIEASNLTRSAAITAVSRYSAERTRAAFGDLDIRVIYNGVDVRRFYPMPRSRPNRPFRLLYVGNWSLRKGADLLGPIMQQLGKDFELYYTADRKNRHERFSLPENCHCLGRLSEAELISVYRESDALLFPSRLEGFGLAAVEAQACGLPVIAARVSSLPEVIEDEITGIICYNHCPEHFVSAVRWLAKRTEVWQKMRGEARERVVELFDQNIIIERYLALYEELLT